MSTYTTKAPLSTQRPLSMSNGLSKDNGLPASMPTGTEALKSSMNAKHDWDQSFQQAIASPQVVSDEAIEQKLQRSDIEALADRLRSQIEQMRHQHAGLAQIAGEVEAHQTNQINSLMSMIASLGRSLGKSESAELPDYQQISGFMRKLEGQLSSQRQQQSSDKSGAERSLHFMKNEQAALERELSIIHQQLLALHSRLVSLGAI